jgi:hypothetical protein
VDLQASPSTKSLAWVSGQTWDNIRYVRPCLAVSGASSVSAGPGLVLSPHNPEVTGSYPVPATNETAGEKCILGGLGQTGGQNSCPIFGPVWVRVQPCRLGRIEGLCALPAPERRRHQRSAPGKQHDAAFSLAGYAPRLGWRQRCLCCQQGQSNSVRRVRARLKPTTCSFRSYRRMARCRDSTASPGRPHKRRTSARSTSPSARR